MLRKLLGVAVAATVAISAAPAAYGDTDPVEDVPTVTDAAQAELEDLRQLATEEGITLDEAVARYGWQDDFVAVANRLRDAHPDTYAGAVVAEDGTSGWIAFKGEAPATAAELTAAVPVPVKVVADRGYSEEELRQTLRTTHFGMLEQPGVANSAGEYDIETGVVTVEVEPAEPLTDPEAKERFLARLQPVRAANAAVKVEVKVADKVEMGTEAYIRGGGYLDKTNGATWCTTAFTVKQGSARGVATAAHCGESKLRYLNHGTSSYTTISRKRRHSGGHGDVGWFTTGGYTAARTFYYNRGKTRYVDDTRWAVQGVAISNFGRTTGYKGSPKVHRINVCYGDFCDMVAMDKHYTAGGDSGGPWYRGNTAYGIHSGYVVLGGKKRSTFSEVRYLPQALDISVFER
ncbi:S1 family peptidase [Nonomuraea muscovyensis]